MFNKVVLVGNLTRDIELRYTTSGVAIGNSSIAVTRKITSNGERRDETCFIDISFFGKSAEIANQYLNKGSKLLIEGRLKFDQWTDNNGQNRSKHSIAVESMEMLGSNNQTQQGGYSMNSQNSGGYVQQGGYQSNQYNRQQETRPQAAPQRKQESYSEVPDIDVDADSFNKKWQKKENIHANIANLQKQRLIL